MARDYCQLHQLLITENENGKWMKKHQYTQQIKNNQQDTISRYFNTDFFKRP